MSQIIHFPMYYSVAWKHINKYLYLLINSLIIINPNNLSDLTPCFFQFNKRFSQFGNTLGARCYIQRMTYWLGRTSCWTERTSCESQRMTCWTVRMRLHTVFGIGPIEKTLCTHYQPSISLLEDRPITKHSQYWALRVWNEHLLAKWWLNWSLWTLEGV